MGLKIISLAGYFLPWMGTVIVVSKAIEVTQFSFEDSKAKIKQELRPIPGITGFVLTMLATAGNAAPAVYPILAKVALFSGITPGYSAGYMLANYWSRGLHQRTATA